MKESKPSSTTDASIALGVSYLSSLENELNATEALLYSIQVLQRWIGRIPLHCCVSASSTTSWLQDTRRLQRYFQHRSSRYDLSSGNRLRGIFPTSVSSRCDWRYLLCCVIAYYEPCWGLGDVWVTSHDILWDKYYQFTSIVKYERRESNITLTRPLLILSSGTEAVSCMHQAPLISRQHLQFSTRWISITILLQARGMKSLPPRFTKTIQYTLHVQFACSMRWVL
jgi:hypothetical protein